MMSTRTGIRMIMKLVFWRGKRGKSASERAEAAKSRDSILAASISWTERASKKYVSVERAEEACQSLRKSQASTDLYSLDGHTS